MLWHSVLGEGLVPMHAIIKLAACVAISVLVGLAATPKADAQPYQLQPGDIIEITVLEDPSLNRRVLVGPDGNIALPLAGTVSAGGSSLGEVQGVIGARLRNQFVNPPTVTVSLVALGPPEIESPEGAPEEEEVVGAFYVLGEVNSPGRFAFKKEEPITILQALATAGGVGVFAARTRIQIRSFTPVADKAANENDDDAAEKQVEALPPVESIRVFNYAVLEDGGEASDVFFIQDGDVIVVPERGLFE